MTTFLAPLFAVVLAGSMPIDGARLVDLTHAFDEQTIYWPTARRFHLDRKAHGRTEAGYWYAANDFCAAEHGGTHLDAPLHFAEGRQAAADVPLERLMGPAAVIDVAARAAASADALVSAADIEAFEHAHGRLRPGTIVLLRTGWASRWNDAGRYLGSTAPGDASNLHFPGLGKDAATLLVARGADAVGIDTASIDHGPSRTFDAHRVLAAANVPIFENLANLDRLPATGAWVIALPMKIAGGSGGPLRAVAVVP
jgi:kynurenine formamidase